MLVIRRGEFALALLVGAGAVLVAFWLRFLAEPATREPSQPVTILNTETLPLISENLAKRRATLEKVFEREYPNPFAPAPQ